MLVTIHENEAVFKICRDIIASHVKEMITEFKTELKKVNGGMKVRLDMSEVFIVDAIGITFLIGLYKTAAGRGNSIVLSGCGNPILEIVKMMKLDEVFAVE